MPKKMTKDEIDEANARGLRRQQEREEQYLWHQRFLAILVLLILIAAVWFGGVK